ncbi:MAG: ABC transporter ATP-binding protein [Bacteroidetes bacterium]|nr:ABC transporter ATP-binding protein [Bacteroidota bacterium]MDA0903370.1 ABC transporter ATP-binding protein [Bacteroidota bacterium]MDA1242336.1 ABC transporter ATP-binding protein [Bacteroidota bacterium]
MSQAPPPFGIPSILRRVWRLLTPEERRRTGLILVGIAVNSVIDIGGLTVVIPVIGLVIDPGLIHDNALLARAYEGSRSWGVGSETQFLVAMALGLMAAFAFKAIFNFALNLVQTRFSFGVGHRMSRVMWKHHFSQRLERLRTTASGRVLEEINRWPLAFSSMFIVGNLRFLNEVLVVAIVVVGLLVYKPLVLVGVGLIVGTGAALIHVATKRRLAYYSATAKAVEPQAETLINGAIRGFIEVLSFQASDAISENYLRHTHRLYLTTGNAQVIGSTPAKLYELLAVAGICVAILMSLAFGDSNKDFLNLLILMALSAYKIMPSMTRINAHLINLRAKYHLINVLEEALLRWRYLDAQPQEADLDWTTARMTLRDVSVAYEGGGTVVKGVTWTFEPGMMHAIVGPSGSGKSTVVHALLGLQPAHSGDIMVGPAEGPPQRLGEDVSVRQWMGRVGYLSQQPFMFAGTVKENLTMGVPGRMVDDASVRAQVKALGLEECLGADPLAFHLVEGGQNLSGGQQQRLALLRALQLNRPVLVLDEATSALDDGQRDRVFALLRERAASGQTVLLVTHDKDLAARCDTVMDLGAA